jgi:hypothetical protein
MATVQEITNNINSAYHTYMAQLVLAGEGWETKPTAGGSGEDAWCARQVAEHICGSGGFFAAGIAKAIGAQAAPPAASVLANVDEAVAAMPGAHSKLTNVMREVKADQLSMEVEFGPLGKTSLEAVLGVVAYHYNDHASQLKTLRG